MSVANGWAYGWILLIYVVLQLAWTLLMRTFPDVLGGALLRKIERRNAIDLEKVKDENNQQIEGLKARLDHLRDRGVRSNEREFQAITAAWDHFLDAYAATMQCAIAYMRHPDFRNLSVEEMKQYLEASDLSDRQRDQVMKADDKNQAFSRAVEINQVNVAGQAIYHARNLIGKQAIFIPDDLLASFEAIMQKLAAAQIQRAMEPRYGAFEWKDVEWLIKNGESSRAALLATVRARIFRQEIA